MKGIRKLILIISLSLVLSLLLASHAFAEDSTGEVSDGGETVDTEADGEKENAADESFFTELFRAIDSNAESIFSALAFIGSLIIAFAYKKGLFPFVERSLGTLSAAVSGLRDEVKENEAAKCALSAAIDEKLASCESLISSFKEKLRTLEGQLAEAETERCEREKLKLIMKTEVEMLFEIITASSLPQYQKDRANECFRKMEEKLKAGDSDEACD